MMNNAAAMLKIMGAKNKFTNNHPKFVAFLNAMFAGGIEEDTVIEITVTKPGQEPVTSNIKVRRDDLELIESLREMGKGM